MSEDPPLVRPSTEGSNLGAECGNSEGFVVEKKESPVESPGASGTIETSTQDEPALETKKSRISWERDELDRVDGAETKYILWAGASNYILLSVLCLCVLALLQPASCGKCKSRSKRVQLIKKRDRTLDIE